jgi:hypothetical protein
VPGTALGAYQCEVLRRHLGTAHVVKVFNNITC